MQNYLKCAIIYIESLEKFQETKIKLNKPRKVFVLAKKSLAEFCMAKMKNQKKINYRLAALGIEAALLLAVFLIAESVLFPGLAGAATRQNGFLAKGPNAPTVFFVTENNYKLAIPSAKVFLSYGYKWPQVQTVEQAILDSYPQAKYISENTSAAIYFLDKNVKRYVTQASASALGIRPEAVVSVNRVEFRSYSTGPRLEEAEAQQMAYAESLGAVQQNLAAEKCVPDPAVGGADGCVIYDATVKNDPNLCLGIQDKNYLPSCFATFDAPAGQKATFYCDKISEISLQESCIAKVALRTKNAILCSDIKTKNILNECLAGVGIATGDLDKCSLLPVMTTNNQNTLSQDACVYVYAIMNSDSAACEKMPKGSAYYEGCVKYSNPVNITR